MATILVIAALAVAVLVEMVIRHRRLRLGTPADHLRAGDRALQRGRPEEAEQHYQESIRLDHANPEAHFKLSLVAWQRGDLPRVIDHLRDCQRWAPEAAQVEHGLGAAHYHLGDHEAALRHYQRARELDPENQEVRGNLAALYYELGRVAEAKEVWPEFEPPTAEQVERGRRIARQLEGRGERELQRWDTGADVIVWMWRVARVGLVGWVVWAVLRWLYEARHGPGSAPEPSPVLVIAAGVSWVALWVAVLLIRLMEAHRDRYVRRVMIRAGVATEDVEAVVPRPSGPPWWRVEISGLHLALWLGIPFTVLMFRDSSNMPDWMGWIAVYTLLAWILKGGFLMGLLLVHSERRAAWWHRYRWFGTLKGTLFGLIAVPAIVLAFGSLLLAAAELAERL